MKKKITLGILAHVDAGKTTLSEALLYISGKLRTPGRVDHKNTFLDTYPIERERGITVFSKQARFSTPNSDIILLDTPGHEDFSTEAERTLSLLDYAILVVSGTDGVQNHTRTLWTLLEHYGVPVFIFINKTDITTKSEEELEYCRYTCHVHDVLYAALPAIVRPGKREKDLANEIQKLVISGGLFR